MARTYNQECVLAYALDLLGERWTLLIVRELFLGPRRFGDLHTALPGLGTNLLSKRLKELEEAGLIISSSNETRGQYRLSDDGEALRPMVRQMMLWSIEYFMHRIEPSPARDCIFSNDLQPDSVALALEMFANKCATLTMGTQPQNYVLHLTIDDNSYTYFFMNGEMTARRGADAPGVTQIKSDVETLMKAMRGEVSIEYSVDEASISGDAAVAKHFFTSITPGADVAFEVAALIKARELESPQRPPSSQQPREQMEKEKEDLTAK